LRRLPVIAYEDIGVANPPLLRLVKETVRTGVLELPNGRAEVLSGLAWLLAASPKSRTACDIASLVEVHPLRASIEEELCRLSEEATQSLAADPDTPMIKRALALRQLVVRRANIRNEGVGRLATIARSMQVPDDVMRLTLIGQGTHDLNCYLPLAFETVFARGPHRIRRARAAMRTELVGPILGCTLDMYTRIGQSAYRLLIGNDAELRGLLRRHMNGHNGIQALGILIFHAEGSLLDQSITSGAGEKLRAQVQAEEARYCGFATEADARLVRRWLRRHADRLVLARNLAFSAGYESTHPHGGH
jgi:hypothetical protein